MFNCCNCKRKIEKNIFLKILKFILDYCLFLVYNYELLMMMGYCATIIL